MSSVLHPVGPEPRERYWVRRVAVLVAAVVAIGIVVALVGNAMSAGSAVQAEPAPPTLVPPTVLVTPAESPTAAGASPTASGSPTPGTATSETAGSTASPTPGADVTPDPGQTATTEQSTEPTQADRKKAEQQAAEKKAAATKKAAAEKKKKEKATPALAACPSGDVRATLTGPKKVKAGESAKFALSLINGSGKTCYLKVTSANFTLTVVSGRDRIWSTEDCPKTVATSSRKLAAEKELDWTVAWDGSRSGSGCKQRPEDPERGYYWAIASFDDAKEVRWRVILT